MSHSEPIKPEMRTETRTVHYAGRTIEVTAKMRRMQIGDTKHGFKEIVSLDSPASIPDGVREQIDDDIADWWETGTPC